MSAIYLGEFGGYLRRFVEVGQVNLARTYFVREYRRVQTGEDALLYSPSSDRKADLECLKDVARQLFGSGAEEIFQEIADVEVERFVEGYKCDVEDP